MFTPVVLMLLRATPPRRLLLARLHVQQSGRRALAAGSAAPAGASSPMFSARSLAVAGAGAAAAAAATLFATPAACLAPKSGNSVLYDRHKPILGWWPIGGAKMAGDPRTASLRTLVDHAVASDYEGCEMSAEDIKAPPANADQSMPTCRHALVSPTFETPAEVRCWGGAAD